MDRSGLRRQTAATLTTIYTRRPKRAGETGERATMDNEEKSVALAKLCGWIRPAGDGFADGLWVIETKHPHWAKNYWRVEPVSLPGFNLYEIEYMAIAWEVMIHLGSLGFDDTIEMWFSDEFVCMENPAVAQKMWLDKCLDLAIENGMIQGAGIAP